MNLNLNITIKIDEDKFFNKNNPDEVIYFLETILSPGNLNLRSKVLKRNIGEIVYIKDITEV
jgi:hypothetical protein